MAAPTTFSREDALAELARIDFGDADLHHVLTLVAEVARRAIGGAEAVSVTLVRGEAAMTPAATSDLAVRADERQYEAGYGPCLDAAQSGELLVIDDMAAETRWPTYAPRAVRAGVRSSVSVGLAVHSPACGALNTYSTRPAAFDDESVQSARWLAGYAAVAVANAARYADVTARAEQMQQAMSSRAVIEQAKGMLMILHRCDADEAFGRMVRASQRANRKLRDIATDIVTRASAPTG